MLTDKRDTRSVSVFKNYLSEMIDQYQDTVPQKLNDDVISTQPVEDSVSDEVRRNDDVLVSIPEESYEDSYPEKCNQDVVISEDNEIPEESNHDSVPDKLNQDVVKNISRQVRRKNKRDLISDLQHNGMFNFLHNNTPIVLKNYLVFPHKTTPKWGDKYEFKMSNGYMYTKVITKERYDNYHCKLNGIHVRHLQQSIVSDIEREISEMGILGYLAPTFNKDLSECVWKIFSIKDLILKIRQKMCDLHPDKFFGNVSVSIHHHLSSNPEVISIDDESEESRNGDTVDFDHDDDILMMIVHLMKRNMRRRKKRRRVFLNMIVMVILWNIKILRMKVFMMMTVFLNLIMMVMFIV